MLLCFFKWELQLNFTVFMGEKYTSHYAVSENSWSIY